MFTLLAAHSRQKHREHQPTPLGALNGESSPEEACLLCTGLNVYGVQHQSESTKKKKKGPFFRAVSRENIALKVGARPCFHS